MATTAVRVETTKCQVCVPEVDVNRHVCHKHDGVRELEALPREREESDSISSTASGSVRTPAPATGNLLQETIYMYGSPNYTPNAKHSKRHGLAKDTFIVCSDEKERFNL